jgi:hypothetical protein
MAQSARSTRTIRTVLDRLTSLPKNHLRILRNEGDSLIQIFDAIRDWTLLRYHVCKSGEHRKGARARKKMESPKPSHRATGEAAENLKGHA